MLLFLLGFLGSSDLPKSKKERGGGKDSSLPDQVLWKLSFEKKSGSFHLQFKVSEHKGEWRVPYGLQSNYNYLVNVCFIKIRSKHNSNPLLSLLRIFMKQALFQSQLEFLCVHFMSRLLDF